MDTKDATWHAPKVIALAQIARRRRGGVVPANKIGFVGERAEEEKKRTQRSKATD